MSRGNLQSRSQGLAVVLLAFLLGSWLVVRAHWWEWSINPQYSYGMLVPVLCAALGYLRWKDRPEPAVPGKIGGFVALGASAIGALAIAAVQPVFESNQDWRVLPAVSALAAIALLLSAIYGIGGRTWLAHFWFPVAFLLTGVPWPTNWENRIMDFLMQGNAGICVEALHWMGHQAVQQGHLIALPSGLLGVEEACSGVRSLQNGIMVSLLAGEFWRLGLVKRIGLVILALACALAGNAIRTVFLSLVASADGHDAVARWHDVAGNTILFATIGILWGAAWAMSAKKTAPEPEAGPTFPVGRLKFLKAPALAMSCLWMASLIGTSLWYGRHAAPIQRDLWSLQASAQGRGIREVEIPERTLSVLLNPDVAVAEEWRDADGIQWFLYYFRWEPGRTAIRSAMAVHDPTNCLAAVGMTLEKEFPFDPVEVAGFEIPFHRFLFTRRSEPVYVFHAVESDDGTIREEKFSGETRLQAVREGRRNRGLRVLEVAVRGAESMEDAESRLVQMLSGRLKLLAP